MEAFGGIQSLKHAQELAPDLVLLDVRMADLDGVEVVRLLRSQEMTRHLPVIFLTGDTIDVDNAVSAFDLDPSDLKTKSISAKELVARIRWVLRREVHTLEQSGQLS